jgi:hypothetical protein
MQYLKDYWFLLAFISGVAAAGWQSFQAVEAQASTNAGEIEDLGKDLEIKTNALERSIQTKASAFVVERDHRDFSNELVKLAQATETNEHDIDEMNDKFNDLRIQDQKIEAKIELETEKLKRAIEEASAEQNSILNSILQEIRK